MTKWSCFYKEAKQWHQGTWSEINWVTHFKSHFISGKNDSRQQAGDKLKTKTHTNLGISIACLQNNFSYKIFNERFLKCKTVHHLRKLLDISSFSVTMSQCTGIDNNSDNINNDWTMIVLKSTSTCLKHSTLGGGFAPFKQTHNGNQLSLCLPTLIWVGFIAQNTQVCVLGFYTLCGFSSDIMTLYCTNCIFCILLNLLTITEAFHF